MQISDAGANPGVKPLSDSASCEVRGQAFSGPLRSLLILSHDGKIGDAVVHTSLLAPVKQSWPDCKIGVVCSRANEQFWRSQPLVDEVIACPSRNILQRLWAVRGLWKKKYQIVFNPAAQKLGRSDAWLMRAIGGQVNVGVTANSHFPLDTALLFDWARFHITYRHFLLLEWLGLSKVEMQYQVFIPEKLEAAAEQYWASCGNSPLRILFNTEGSTADRSWRGQPLSDLLETLSAQLPQAQVYLVGRPDEQFNALLLSSIQRLAPDLQQRVQITPSDPNPLFVGALMQKADVILSPDTFAVHLAASQGKPVVAVYHSPLMQVLWSPLNTKNVMLLAADSRVDSLPPTQIAQAISNLSGAA